MKWALLVIWPLILVTLLLVQAIAANNLLTDPSFEIPKPRDRWGHVFQHWAGWIYSEGSEFRASTIARTGKHSLLLVGGTAAKLRAWPAHLTLPPGRYRLTAYLRGLDIGKGPYGETTELMFAGKYLPLDRNGTFGWSQLTYVGEVSQRVTDAPFPSFGLLAPGYLWVDDVTLERVGNDVPLTPRPLLGRQESPVAAPGPLGDSPVRCPECGYRNNLSWGQCYACGTTLQKKSAATGPEIRLITSFEDGNPFTGGTVVSQQASDGKKALRIDKGYVSLDAAQNWAGYDYFEADVYTAAKKPLELYVEIRDRQTRDYWTRVNYTTIVPPGASKLVIPTALYVGEKSRPGRALLLDQITRLVFSINDRPEAPLFIDNLRLRRDTQADKVRFDGLWAFDVGPSGSPVMEGFTPLDASKTYSRGRGYGWRKARIWRGFDALQPDPLYRDFLCLEQGGLAIDVPNGKYHVFVNMDSPSGYWGEVQRYRRRALIVEGRRHEERQDLSTFLRHYFRNYDREDLPTHNTFDTYQLPYFQEKQLVVEVRDGQLNIDFEGENWACCVSAIVVYPADRAEQGQRFLEFVKERRRFHFDNAFKRILNTPTGSDPSPDAAQRERGFLLFQRDWMQDVHHNDRPQPDEALGSLQGSAFVGEMEPLTLSLYPLRDLGEVTLRVTDLEGQAGNRLASSTVAIGYVQHRLSRVTAEGSVYTITPRLIQPRATAPVPAGLTRTFWLTVRVPSDAKPGIYSGSVQVQTSKAGTASVPLRFTVRRGTLDAVDIPVGPWGHTIDLPWYEEEVGPINRQLARRSLRKLREYGFTTASGLPVVSYKGFQGGRPQFDFTIADEQMRMFREEGFSMPVVSYCPLPGLNLYQRDQEAMTAAGFTDQSAFVRTVFGAIQRHAERANWLPVYWNIGDEPIGDDLSRSAENAEAYRKAFPKGPPTFTAATSFKGNNRADPHYRLSKALHVANWNDHDETAVELLRSEGGDWAFYNGGNRWTYGVYLYKAAKQFGLKFRLSWHWNVVAGDPYYPLDCREDDYAWCVTNPRGELIPAVHFERLREGLDDYRRLLTLARLIEEQQGTVAAQQGQEVLEGILAGFRLGQRERTGVANWAELRQRLDTAIERLRSKD
jgi:hypothetical protein